METDSVSFSCVMLCVQCCVFSLCTTVLLLMVQPATVYLAKLHIQMLMISTIASQPMQMLQGQLQELLVPLHCILALPDLPQSAQQQ